MIELIDGGQTSHIALKRGNSQISITDTEGHMRDYRFNEFSLYPCIQSIFSVQAATEKRGSYVKFGPNYSEPV